MSKLMKQMMAEARLAKVLAQPPANPRRYSADSSDADAYATYQQACIDHGGYPTVYLNGKKCELVVKADEVVGEVFRYTGMGGIDMETCRGRVHVLWDDQWN